MSNKPKHPKMMNTIFRSTIMADKLKDLGFVYKMNIWRRDNLSIQFYKYCWKCSVPGSKEFDIIYMDELYPLFWELTGKVLPNIERD